MALMLHAISLDGKVYCGYKEHKHGDECYETITGNEDQTESESSDDALAAEERETQFICEVEEHTHSLICFSNVDADTENASVWESTVPQNLSGTDRENLVFVAESQLGYTEEQLAENLTDARGEVLPLH